jgi:hypothetical protein
LHKLRKNVENLGALIPGIPGAVALIIAALISRPRSGAQAREVPEGTPQSTELVRYVRKRRDRVAYLAVFGGLGVGFALGLFAGGGGDDGDQRAQAITETVTRTAPTKTVEVPADTPSASSGSPTAQNPATPPLQSTLVYSDSVRLNTSGYDLSGAQPTLSSQPATANVVLISGRLRFGSSDVAAAWTKSTPSVADCYHALHGGATYSNTESSYDGLDLAKGRTYCFNIYTASDTARIGYLKIGTVTNASIAAAAMEMWDVKDGSSP